MALWNQGVKEKYLTPVEWEILLLFSDKKWKLLNYKHRNNNNDNNDNREARRVRGQTYFFKVLAIPRK